MPNSVVAGKLRAVEVGLITLGRDLRIIVPPEMVTDIPLGTSLTVVVHKEPNGWLVAESVRVKTDREPRSRRN